MAYDFTAASSQYLTCSAPVTAGPVTISCWFNAKDVTTTGSLVSIGIASGSNDVRFTLFHAGSVAGDPVRFFASNINPNALANADTTSGYTANTWNHACGVASSATSRTVYLNGGSQVTNTFSVAPVNLTTLAIGSRFLSGYGTYANALIAEVGIWNAALTAEEIASLADGMTCDKIRPQSLVFYAPLVRDLIDVKGGLTITNNNSATVANHPRVYS
jgi:hypothetical protein